MMKLSGLLSLVSCAALMLGTFSLHPAQSRNMARLNAQALGPIAELPDSENRIVKTAGIMIAAQGAASAHYRLDAAQSRFMVRAFSGGLLFFKGHDHFIQVRDFTGEAELVPDAVNQASLQMRVRADSLSETRDVFTEQQKQIINKELREIVLETNKFPEISFRSTEVTGKMISNGQYDVRIGGDLTLHGVTRHLVIPAHVALEGDTLRARGEFTIKRSDYNVKATSAIHGLIRVRDKLAFTFDIVARPS